METAGEAGATMGAAPATNATGNAVSTIMTATITFSSLAGPLNDI